MPPEANTKELVLATQKRPDYKSLPFRWAVVGIVPALPHH